RKVECLSDPQKRKEYDDIYKAKLAQKVRTEQLDGARRKRKEEELEAKEIAAKKMRTAEEDRLQELQKIERLRKENMQRLQEVHTSASAGPSAERMTPPSEGENTKGGILLVKPKKGHAPDQKEVERIFQAYGIFTLVATKKAFLLEFSDIRNMLRAIHDETNSALSNFKLTIQREVEVELKPPTVEVNTQNTSEYEAEILRHMRQRDLRRKMKEKPEDSE
ncbi:hypothetical protein HDU67_005266, partial [Dinochytrium kinnereticum]